MVPLFWLSWGPTPTTCQRSLRSRRWLETTAHVKKRLVFVLLMLHPSDSQLVAVLCTCGNIRRAPCFVPRALFSKPSHHCRRHPRALPLDPSPRKAARGDRRPSDDRARLPSRERRALGGRPCSWRPTTSASPTPFARSAATRVMTSASHQTGTDRLAEVAATIGSDLVVNVQGDEPLIEPAIDRRGRGRCSTGARPAHGHAAAPHRRPGRLPQPERRQGRRRRRRLRAVLFARADSVRPRRTAQPRQPGGTSGCTSIGASSC